MYTSRRRGRLEFGRVECLLILVCVARATKEEVCGRARDVSDDRETSQDGEQWMQVSRCAKLSSGKVMRLVAAPPSLSLLTTPWGQ